MSAISFQNKILDSLSRKSWKDKLIAYQTLITFINTQHSSDLSELEPYFLQMLKQKNLNLISKVFELITVYTKSNTISKIQVRDLVKMIFNFTGVPLLPIENVIASLYKDSQKREVLNEVVEFCNTRSISKSHRAFKILRILVEESRNEETIEDVLNRIKDAPNISIYEVQQEVERIRKLVSSQIQANEQNV